MCTETAGKSEEDRPPANVCLLTDDANPSCGSSSEAVEVLESALASFFHATAEKAEHGWWYYIDRNVCENQAFEDCHTATPKLSFLTGTDPLVTSWMLSTVGLTKLPRSSSTKRMNVDMDAWQSFIGRHGLPMELGSRKQKGSSTTQYYVRIGELASLSLQTMQKKHQFVVLPNAYGLHPILKDCDKGLREKPKISGLSFHANLLLRSMVKATGMDLALDKIQQLVKGKIVLDNKDGDYEKEQQHQISGSSPADGSIPREANPTIEHHLATIATTTTTNTPIVNVEKFLQLQKFNIKTEEDISAILSDIQSYHQQSSLTFKYGNKKQGKYMLLRKSSSSKKYRAFMVGPRVGKEKTFLEEMLTFQASDDGEEFDENEAARTLIDCLYDKYNNEFVDVCDRAGLMTPKAKMDEVTAAAMFQQGGVTTTGRRILCKFLRETFGKNCIPSESKVRNIYKESVVAPQTGVYLWKVEGKAQPVKVKYSWKELDKVIVSAMKNDLDLDWTKDPDVRVVLGGDHGGGVFRMFVRIVVKCNNNNIQHSTYQIGQIESPHDKTLLLRNTIGPKVSASMERITRAGKKLSLLLDGGGKVLSVVLGDSQNTAAKVMNVRLHFTGDLKFYFQVAGREGMCTNWCFWCPLSKEEWCIPIGERRSCGVREEHEVPWTLELIKKHRDALKKLKKKDKKSADVRRGVVECDTEGAPVWDFVEVIDYFFPVLHAQIGLTNDVLTRFFEWVDENLEPLSEEEQCLRRMKIIADVFVDEAKTAKDAFDLDELPELNEKRKERVECKKAITVLNNKKKPTDAQKEELKWRQNEYETLSSVINAAVMKEKVLKKTLSTANEQYQVKKQAVESYRKRIGKAGRSLRSLLDDKLNDFRVSAAAYHGGDLNGGSCRELMEHTEKIFVELKQICISFIGKKDDNGKSMNSGNEGELEEIFKVYSTILRLLGASFSILRRGWGKATTEDTHELEAVLVQLDVLWRKMNLSWTPKWHGLREHSVEQLKASCGYKEFQEDWVEAGHQSGNRDMIKYRSVKGYENKSMCMAMSEAARNSSTLNKKAAEVKAMATRKRKHTGPTKAEATKQQEQDKKKALRKSALEESKHINSTNILSGYDKHKAAVTKEREGFCVEDLIVELESLT